MLAAALLVVAATVFRGWQLQGVWFFYDDLYFIQRAVETPLTAAYLVEPYNGHLMPAGHLLTWVNAAIDPTEFAWPAAEILLGFLVYGAVTARLFLRLFGRSWPTLVPLTVALFTPFLLPATMWWAAAVNQVPMLIALVLATTAWVEYLRAPRVRQLVATLAWLALGLLFVERTLLGLPMLWLLALLYFTSGPLPVRLRELVSRYWRAMVAQGAFVGAYLVVYVAWAANFDARSVTNRPLFGVLHDLVGTAFGSAATGGPLRWHVSEVTQSETDPTQVMLALSWLVVLVVMVSSALTRRRGLRAWLIPLTTLLANVALVSISRAIYFGDEIALDLRFQTESALTWPLAIGLAFLPLLGARESSEPREEAPWTPTSRSWVLVGCLAFVALATVSTARYPLRNLTTTSPERYFSNLDAALAEQPDRPLLNRTVPTWLWAPLAYPTNDYEHMFAMLGRELDLRDIATDEVWVVDDTGNLRVADLDVTRRQARGPGDDGCFGHAGAGRSTWLLDGPVIGPAWYVRLRYTSPADTDAVITVADRDNKISLAAGSHEVLLPGPAADAYNGISLTLPLGAEDVCLRDLAVGEITPAD
ncbi:hypothetical protein ASC77_02985 [Nocardioides sp. Root1257]|nr:hypothetical protein ASC77_02985 [Nocardioides sp. Root1257]KRC55957.1 hypothetical protein ASE24_02985 [Nocardioides sp. Root224]